MTSTRQTVQLAFTALAAVALCCQCKTTEETDEVISSLNEGSKFGRFGKLTPVGHKRQSGYKFSGVNDNELESEKSDGASNMAASVNNEKVIRNSDGEVVRKEKRNDLYSDRGSHDAQETGRAFKGNRDAKLKSSKYLKKEFKTPEYLKRQEFAGAEAFRDGSQTASEDSSESSLGKKLFSTTRNRSGDNRARENGATADSANKLFSTRSDRSSARAQANAAVPDPVNGLSGYQENAAMSIDDVKKLVNPSSIR